MKEPLAAISPQSLPTRLITETEIVPHQRVSGGASEEIKCLALLAEAPESREFAAFLRGGNEPVAFCNGLCYGRRIWA